MAEQPPPGEPTGRPKDAVNLPRQTEASPTGTSETISTLRVPTRQENRIKARMLLGSERRFAEGMKSAGLINAPKPNTPEFDQLMKVYGELQPSPTASDPNLVALFNLVEDAFNQIVRDVRLRDLPRATLNALNEQTLQTKETLSPDERRGRETTAAATLHALYSWMVVG